MPVTTSEAYIDEEYFASVSLPSDALTDLEEGDVENAIEAASRTVDSYLRKRFSLPLVSWGNDVSQAVADLAQYNLLSRRGFRPNSGNDEIVVRRRDDAVKWLENVARGLVEPDIVDSTPELDEEGSLAHSDNAVSMQWNTRGKC